MKNAIKTAPSKRGLVIESTAKVTAIDFQELQKPLIKILNALKARGIPFQSTTDHIPGTGIDFVDRALIPNSYSDDALSCIRDCA